MEGPYDLPEEWTWTTIDEVCERVSQVDPRSTPTRLFQYVDISSIDNKANCIVATKEMLGADAPSRARKPIRDGDVLFSTVRTYLKNVAPVPARLSGEIASTGFCVLRAGDKVDPRFLFRYVLSNEFVNRVSELQRGISYPAVTDRDVYSQSMPLPPLPEQLRLVEKIERLLEQSRTAREALDRIPPLLKRFRQAVLAKAFRGELTERDVNDEPASVLVDRIREERRRKWEEDLRARGKDPRKAKYVEPEPPDTSGLPEVPEGWAWASLGGIFTVSTGGTPSRKRADFWNGDIPWVSSGEVAFHRISETRETITDLGLRSSSAKVLPPGTVLLGMIGEGRTRGQAAIIEIPAATNQNVAAIAGTGPDIAPAYVFYWLMARYEETREAGKGGAQPALNGARVRQIELPIAPALERRRIVARVDALFAEADAIEEAVAKVLRRAEHVDQAVLARAFRGQL